MSRPNPGTYNRQTEIAAIAADWAEHPRWQAVQRTYSAEDVVRLRGSLKCDNTLARHGAEKLWALLTDNAGPVRIAPARSGAEAIRQLRAGAAVIQAGAPALPHAINAAFERADQIQWKTGDTDYVDCFAPIVADADCGGTLDLFECVKTMIRAGAAAVRVSDHTVTPLGKLLTPTQEAMQQLIAARLAADVEGVPTLIVAHTAAHAADLICIDSNAHDQATNDECHEENVCPVQGCIEHAIERGLAFAPYADVLWLETEQPDLVAAQQFADAIRREYPHQLLAYRCAASESVEKRFDIAGFRRALAELGYTLQNIEESSSDHRAINGGLELRPAAAHVLRTRELDSTRAAAAR